MKIFNSIRKKYLQHKVYKYTLKSDDALSKFNHYLELSEKYTSSATNIIAGDERMFGSIHSTNISVIIKLHKAAKRNIIKSKHFMHLSEMYSDKLADYKEELCKFNYRKV